MKTREKNTTVWNWENDAHQPCTLQISQTCVYICIIVSSVIMIPELNIVEVLDGYNVYAFERHDPTISDIAANRHASKKYL